jgi:DNA-directed RNA polymerase subunit G
MTKERLTFKGRVKSKVPGTIPGVQIAKIEGDGVDMEMDVLREYDVIPLNSEVEVELSKERPNFTENDFCAHGHLFLEKEMEGRKATLLSLYGLVVKFWTTDGLIKSGKFSMMDHVYLCVRPSPAVSLKH